MLSHKAGKIEKRIPAFMQKVIGILIVLNGILEVGKHPAIIVSRKKIKRV